MPDNVTSTPTRLSDPFQTSVLARTALTRVFAVALGLIPLWLAIAWAVSVP